jgi:hypothetical protein
MFWRPGERPCDKEGLHLSPAAEMTNGRLRFGMSASFSQLTRPARETSSPKL